eukprot:jgi/Psemu1/260060/estExt_Genewise1Plus.C_4120007
MSTDKTIDSSEPRKRPRVDAIEKAKDALGASESVANTEEKSTPEYGSQEYWEDRYKSNPDDQHQKGEDDPEPYHAWYFKFEDLAPLLMPLILGDDEEDNHENEEIDLEQNEAGNENGNESGEESDDFEVIEMNHDDDDDEEPVFRVGLAKDGPISVLEVGCGDAPLGRDLALSIQDYGVTTEQDPSTIIQKIVCLDYSKNVIETMKDEQQKNQGQSDEKEKGPQVHYEVADARQLSYKNESFEMILEKGTLDAMLSDSNGSGQENCRKIVSECARVLKVGGYIIIISHLNARVESGVRWLNDVVVPGLRAAGDFEWLVEVHGSDVEIPSDDEDGTGEEECIESPGPAVYFIEKVGTIEQVQNSDGSEQSPPTIPLKIFSY